MSCETFRDQIFHFQNDEVSADERGAFEAHLAECADCARRLAVEDQFRTALKRRLEPATAPPGLESRVRTALADLGRPRVARGWLGAPTVVAAAAVVLALLILIPGLGLPPWSRESVAVDREVLVVDLQCDRIGRSLAQQRRCEDRRHVNALSVGPQRYWNLALDSPDAQALLVDRRMRGHRLRVQGTYYKTIRTVHLTSVEDLGQAGRLQARAFP